MFVLFLSKNENNNSFDLVGLNSFSLIIGVWCFLSFSVVSCIVVLGCLFNMDEMLRFEHHLAAKFGTRLAAFFCICHLCYGWMIHVFLLDAVSFCNRDV